MSHGSIEKCEPNLIPMLDLVLQLIMFFMLVTNFIADDLNESIKLPHALQAMPLEKSEDYVITLNMDRKGRVLLMQGTEAEIDALLAKNPGDPRVLTNQDQVASYMRNKMIVDRERIARAEAAGAKLKPRVSLVVLRGHKEATYEKVNAVLEACRRAGYGDVQLRATIGRGGE